MQTTKNKRFFFFLIRSTYTEESLEEKDILPKHEQPLLTLFKRNEEENVILIHNIFHFL